MASATKNPVIREFLGETAQDRREKQTEIISRPSTWTPASAEPSGFTPAQRSEMTSLENQRRQAQVDMDIDTMNALDARMKAIRASAGQQTFSDRADENMSGWVKNTAAAYAKAGEDLLGFINYMNNAASSQRATSDQEAKNRAHYEEILARGTWDTGELLTDADRAKLTNLIGKSDARVKAANDYLDAVNSPVASLQQKVGAFGDRNAQEAAVHSEAARNGATTLEKILLDTGNVVGDVASDFALNTLAPGLGTASRVTRMYGSGSREAEEKGLGGAGQFAYGATKAALGEVTNRMFSGNPILEKATGKGAIDDILLPGLERTIPGAMLKGGVGEAIEETAENLADIPLQWLFFRDKADKVSAKDIGYDALIAAIIGSLTGISGKKSDSDIMDVQNVRNGPVETAGAKAAQTDGNSIGTQENAVHGVSDAKPVTLEEILFGGKRVGVDKLTDAQAQQADAGNMAGTVGMDADNKLFQVDPAQHIDQRGAAEVADRSVNAFQYDHPQLHAYYKGAAEAMLSELNGAVKGGETQSATGEYGQTYSWFNKRSASPRIASLLDGGMTYADVETALDAIIHDKGQENYANAKRVEMVLDDMLTNGYNDGTRFVPSNQDYVTAKDAIAGSQAASRGHGLDDIDVYIGGEGANAVNENGLNAFSEQERVNLSSGKKNKVVSTFSEAVSFVKNALSNKQNVDRAYLGKVPDAVARKVMADTGVDISGYSAVIPGDSVRHMFNRHGDPLIESALGQVPLTPEIAARIPEILANPDKVTLSDKVDASGRQALLFEKSIGDQYITVQAVSNGTHSIQTDTLYVQKKTPQGTVSNAGANAQAPNSNVQNVPPQGSSIDSTIAQGVENVNSSQNGENDGLGNANAGTVNTAFDDMQARSDTFHPVNQQSAQRVMNDQNRAPSEVPTVNPDTGKNIGKTVSTILNSPLTSPEMAVEIESAVADGQFDYVPVTDRAANLKAQQDISNRGLKTVADSFIAKVELGQRITKNDMASAIAAYNQSVAAGDHATAFELMNAIAESARDSAQVVQAMNLMNRLTPEGRLLTLRRFVDHMNRRQSGRGNAVNRSASATQESVDAARTNYVEQATGFRISDELAANYLMAQTDAERAAAWDAITTDIASQIPSTFREKANFWRYTSMLLNPTTHVRNFLGNAIQAGARTIKNGVGAVIERAVVKDTSQRTKSFLTGKERKALKDFAKTQYEADQKAAMGAGKYSDASTAGINREIQDKRKVFQGSDPLSRAVQAVGDFNSKALDWGDVIFNKSAYVDSFAQALQAKGVTAADAASGAKADLVAAARAYAIEEAQRATYRNTTALSEVLSKMGRYEGDNPVAKGLSFAADAFLPFRRTPANILTTGLDYSPVGLAKAITYDAYQVKAGNMSAADMVDHLSAGLTGSGILLLGAYLASEGMLRVKAGDDDREEDYNKAQGIQDYSLQIGDKSYTLDWAVPAAMPLFAGAAIMESVQKGGNGFDAVADAMGGITEVVLETSMLSSLNDLISNWSYADNKAAYLIDRTVTSYAGQYIPTVGGKIASAMDGTVRKSYVEKGTGQVASDIRYFAQSAAKKIPGARDNLQPSVDLWGNEVSNGTAGERVFQNFLSPGYLKTVQTGKVDEELRRLAESTGSSSVYPAQVDKSFSVNGEGKNLTAEEYTKYAKAVGETRFKAVSALIRNTGYQKLSDEEKAKAIADAYEYANAKGKQAVSGYQPSGFAKGAMSSVLPIDSYILYSINADRDGNGSVSGTESALTLKEISGISDQVRGKAWAQKNNSANEAKNPFIGALPKAGISVDTSIKIYEKYRSLSNAEGMKPKEKGAQLRSYVNSLGLTPSQLQAVKDTYTLFGSYPVDW